MGSLTKLETGYCVVLILWRISFYRFNRANFLQAYCFTTWQQFLVDISNAQKAVLQAGMAFYNFGDTQPAPEYQGYPWLYSVDMRWYRLHGVWSQPNPGRLPMSVRIYVGD